MKRIGNLYKQICSMDNLILAHQNAKKGKGWYKEVRMIDRDPHYYLGLLQVMLVNHTYKTSEYETFIKKDSGKEREIYKLPYFPDRVAQWAILQVIEPYIIKTLVIDTYSAIPKRGIHFGLKRIIHDIQTDVKGCQYCLKLDAKKYYPSIDHIILKKKYRKLFKDSELLWILDEIIDSTEGEIGIPIGNYLSQYSGNYYFSSFDHWMKEEKGVPHYHRYMDDICIFSDSKEKLHKLKKEVDEYFENELKLTIKGNWQVFPTYVRGVDFLGYRVFLNFILLRKSICKQMKKKMSKLLHKCETEGQMNYSEWCSINSYSGWLIHCNAYRLGVNYIQPLLIYAENYYLKFIRKVEGT